MTIREDCARRIARKSWKIEEIIFEFRDDARYPIEWEIEQCPARNLDAATAPFLSVAYINGAEVKLIPV